MGLKDTILYGAAGKPDPSNAPAIPTEKKPALWRDPRWAWALGALMVFAAIGIAIHHSTSTAKADVTHGELNITTTSSLVGSLSGAQVWCAWRDHMPTNGRKDLSSLLGTADHVIMHITIHNSSQRTLRVGVTPQYLIGNQTHGDSWSETQYEPIAPGSYSWFLNAGSPEGVKANTRIAACSPELANVSR